MLYWDNHIARRWQTANGKLFQDDYCSLVEDMRHDIAIEIEHELTTYKSYMAGKTLKAEPTFKFDLKFAFSR